MTVPLERILSMGITGSGKSYQWLNIARELLPTGAQFRCIDTDNDIPYMLETQFPDLLPENKGNVHVYSAPDWVGCTTSIKAIKKEMAEAKIKRDDWLVVDKVNNPWAMVQDYFVSEVFNEDPGEYFLAVRKEMLSRGDKDSKGKKVSSILREALEGWKDWVVINQLYRGFIRPVVYQIPCHVYMATDVEKVEKDEKDMNVLNLFGGFGVKPAGQKGLGGQVHSVLLLIPGTNKWLVSTAKDRAGRKYFDKTPLTSLYVQYLVAKAGWETP